MDIEGLQKLHGRAAGAVRQERSKREALAERERDDAQRKVVEVANKIASIAKQGDAPVWIVNLNRYRHFPTRSYSSYWIPGRKKDEKFASTIIAPAVATLQSQAFTRSTKPVRYYKPLEIAEDLCQEINGDLPFFQTVGPFSNLDNMGDQGARVKKTRGAFVSASSVPDKELLERETEKLTTYYMALADERARQVFGRTRDRKLLTTLHFRSGREPRHRRRGVVHELLDAEAVPGLRQARQQRRGALASTAAGS